MSTKARFRGELRPHQLAALSWLLNHRRAVLSDDVGLGKTVEALALIAELAARGELERNANSNLPVLWLTEATLIQQAKAEFRRFIPGLQVLAQGDPEMGDSKKAKGLYADSYSHSGPDVLLLSYEFSKSRKEWVDQWTPALVVLDEAGKLRGGGALAKSVLTITERVAHRGRVLSMTATPYQNDPTELYAVLSAAQVPNLWPRRVFEDELVAWAPGYVDQWGKTHMKAVGWTEPGLTRAREFLADALLFRTVSDAGLELPELHRRDVWVPLTAAQRRAYDNATTAGTGLAVHQRREASGKSTGAVSSLVSAMVAGVKQVSGQAIVYCETLAVLELAAKALTDARVTFRRLEGKVREADRARAIEDHRTDPTVRVLLGSRVLEQGLNLQHCPLLISLDSSWNPARERQREGRIRRIGSPFQSVEHVRLLPDTPLTRRKLGELDRKSADATAALAGLDTGTSVGPSRDPW